MCYVTYAYLNKHRERGDGRCITAAHVGIAKRSVQTLLCSLKRRSKVTRPEGSLLGPAQGAQCTTHPPAFFSTL